VYMAGSGAGAGMGAVGKLFPGTPGTMLTYEARPGDIESVTEE